MSDVVTLNVESQVAHVVLNRPDKRNAINLDMFRALADTGDRIAADPGIRAVVLSGAGDSFCAGFNVALAQGFTVVDLLAHYFYPGVRALQSSPGCALHTTRVLAQMP